MTGRELRALLAPMSPEKFLQDYWLRRSAHIRGRRDKFATLFDRARFFEAILRAGGNPAPGTFSVRAETVPEVRPDQARALFESGLSLCATDISAGSPELAAFAAAVQDQLGFPGYVRVNSYLSPEGKGLDRIHIDARVATTLQIEGRKRWWYADAPAVPWPRHQARFDGPRLAWPDGGPEPWERAIEVDRAGLALREVVLEPGDVLCLPAGTWHGAQAVGGASLSLNLAFQPMSTASIVLDAIRARLEAEPAWRGVPPAETGGGGHGRRGGRVPADVARFFGARIEELKQLLDSLRPDGLELNRAWRAATRDPLRAAVGPPRAGLGAAGARPVRRQDVFLVPPEAPLTYALGPARDGDGGEEIVLMGGGGGEWAAAGDGLLPFVRRLVRARRFVASSATGWAGGGARYPWPAVKSVLERLLRGGFIRREAR